MGEPGGSPAFRVLVVDDAGVVGSVLGARLTRHHLALRGVPADLVEVTSAGLEAVDGAPMPQEVADLLALYGADASPHSARKVTAQLLTEPDIIITGNTRVSQAIAERWLHAAPKVFRMTEVAEIYDHIVAIAPLGEHARLLNAARSATAIDDRYDMEREATEPENLRATADEIDKASAWIAGVWASMAPSPEGVISLPQSVGPRTDIDLDAFGVAVRVRVTGEDRDALAATVRRVWSRCLRTDEREPEVDIEICVHTDPRDLAEAHARRAITHGDVEAVMHVLTSTVTVRAIEARKGELVMLHAAGLATADGSVFAFIAPSGTGKTTIARQLGRRVGYVTDETLAIAMDGTVVPYPKPLSLVTGEGQTFKEQWGPESLGLREPTGPLKLKGLMLLERDPRWGGQPRREEMELLDGLAALASQVSYLRELPERLHTLAALVESVGGVSKLRYREAMDIMATIEAAR